MKLQEATDIYIGSTPVTKIMLGDTKVWPKIFYNYGYVLGTFTYLEGSYTGGPPSFRLNEDNFIFGSTADNTTTPPSFISQTFIIDEPLTSLYYFGYRDGNQTRIKSIDLTHFNTSSVTDMRCMFSAFTSLESIDLTNFDTSSATNIYHMFDRCMSLTSLDLSSFDTSSVTNMGYLFSECSSLTSVDLSSFDTSSVESMKYMFSKCSSLTSIDLTHFNTSSVTDLSGMFYLCSSLTSVDLSGWDVRNVEAISFIFAECSSLTYVDLSGWDLSNVQNKLGMFKNITTLTDIYITNINTLNLLTNNLSGEGSSLYIPSTATIHYNDGTTQHDYVWTGNSWT